MFLFVHYCSDMFRPLLLAIFRELVGLSMCATYVSTYFFTPSAKPISCVSIQNAAHIETSNKLPEDGQ